MYNRLNSTRSSELEAVELKTINASQTSSERPLTSSLVANDYANKNQISLESDDLKYNIQAASSSIDASTNESIIRLRNIHKTYLLGLEGVPALRGVSVTIKRGEFIVILGKSGGGKTSMLNIIGTIDKPTKGDIYIAGKRISSKTTDTEVANLRLRKIGFCFQTFNLISSMTAVENVELPMILHGTLSSKQIRQRAMALLTKVGLANRASHLPSQLSGGEQQRVTISRAIANNPDVLLLDEPTGDLDSKNSHIIMDILVKLNREKNITCVFVTHDVSLKSFAHRVIHMLDGKISKIEMISKRRRANAERELQEGLQNDNNPNKSEVSNKKEIEVREPKQFYGYLAFKQQYDEKQRILKEKRRRKRLLRRSEEGSDFEEEDEDVSDNEIVDEEEDEVVEEEQIEVDNIELQTAEIKNINDDANINEENDDES